MSCTSSSSSVSNKHTGQSALECTFAGFRRSYAKMNIKQGRDNNWPGRPTHMHLQIESRDKEKPHCRNLISKTPESSLETVKKQINLKHARALLRALRCIHDALLNYCVTLLHRTSCPAALETLQ
jgi:hypothetical protein